MERRKVYIEFQSKTSVEFVTPYLRKFFDISEKEDNMEIDLISLKWCNSVPLKNRNFWARVKYIDTDNDGNKTQPECFMVIYVRVKPGADQNAFRDVGAVACDQNGNKRIISVSFPT